MRAMVVVALVAAAALLRAAGAADASSPALTAPLHGRVLDLGGRPLPGAMLTWEKPPGAAGATAVTVFADAAGEFRFPEGVGAGAGAGRLAAKLLGYRQLAEQPPADAAGLTILMRADANQAGIAPASAWLGRAGDSAAREQVVMNCVGCHQLPSPEVRAYARSVADVPGADAATAEQSWRAMVHYMNYLSAWEFGRAGGAAPDAARVYSGGEPGPMAVALARTLTGSFGEIGGYHHGAPLLADGRAVIREYAVPQPNAIREAVTLASPDALWVADVSSNRMIRVDARSGAARAFEVPVSGVMGPHTLVPGRDGTLWVTSFFPGTIARLEPASGQWRTWTLRKPDGRLIGVHDLSFDANHELQTDRHGRIWYSDILDNAVGWLDPRSGRVGIHRVPPVPGRSGNEQLYGLAMSADRTHVWYSQLGIGCFGSFNIETGKFETQVQLPDASSGPRRMAMSDGDILYVALYGSGQLAEYDTRARRMIGIYDLPDRASAPYATTWDPLRKVVWIVTSNANLLYRFDPRDKSFAVLPLPREGAFLRMVAVDRSTGALVSSYANIVQDVQGPRMALSIDLGDRPALPAAVAAGATVAAGNRFQAGAPDVRGGALHAAESTPLPGEAAIAADAVAADVTADVPTLLQQHRCVACHAPSDALVGPPYAAIAARHAGAGPAAAEALAHKILLGGGGAWGAVPMPPSQSLSLPEARQLAGWVLAQKP
jgi:streptogramin lyase/cytochrome c551/c552